MQISIMNHKMVEHISSVLVSMLLLKRYRVRSSLSALQTARPANRTPTTDFRSLLRTMEPSNYRQLLASQQIKILLPGPALLQPRLYWETWYLDPPKTGYVIFRRVQLEHSSQAKRCRFDRAEACELTRSSRYC